jgi:hypothetical protein
VKYTVKANLLIEADSPQEAARIARRRNSVASHADAVAKQHVDIAEVCTDSIAINCVAEGPSPRRYPRSIKIVQRPIKIVPRSIKIVGRR